MRHITSFRCCLGTCRVLHFIPAVARVGLLLQLRHCAASAFCFCTASSPMARPMPRLVSFVER
jgi:hypothetical protein